MVSPASFSDGAGVGYDRGERFAGEKRSAAFGVDAGVGGWHVVSGAAALAAGLPANGDRYRSGNRGSCARAHGFGRAGGGGDRGRCVSVVGGEPAEV